MENMIMKKTKYIATVKAEFLRHVEVFTGSRGELDSHVERWIEEKRPTFIGMYVGGKDDESINDLKHSIAVEHWLSPDAISLVDIYEPSTTR